MLIVIGPVLSVSNVRRAPEMGRAYAGAQGLAEALGSPSESLGLPSGQARTFATGSDLDLGAALRRDLLHPSH